MSTAERPEERQGETIWTVFVKLPLGQGRRQVRQRLREQLQTLGDQIWAQCQLLDPGCAGDESQEE